MKHLPPEYFWHITSIRFYSVFSQTYSNYKNLSADMKDIKGQTLKDIDKPFKKFSIRKVDIKELTQYRKRNYFFLSILERNDEHPSSSSESCRLDGLNPLVIYRSAFQLGRISHFILSFVGPPCSIWNV